MHRPLLYLAVFLGGWAGLTWELIWFHHAALITGVTAQASALILAGVMVGMTGGALLAGRLSRWWQRFEPIRVYGGLELIIGITAIGLLPAFDAVGALDAAIWARAPGLATPLSSLLLAVAVLVPAMGMGATMPVLADIAQRHGFQVSRFYALNLAGAGIGILLVSWLVVPAVGFAATSALMAGINLLVFVLLFLGSRKLAPSSPPEASEADRTTGPAITRRKAALVAACTGFATFNLEVSWFRSIRAAIQATSESFAMMLAVVLLALHVGAVLSPRLRARGIALPTVLVAAGLAVLLTTPLIERLDLLFLARVGEEASYGGILLLRLATLLVVLGIPMTLIGASFPWVLDAHRSPRSVALLYATNTLGAVAGALLAAWLLLPTIGFRFTALVAGLALFLPAVALSGGARRAVPATAAGLGAGVLALTGSGIGTARVQSSLIFEDYAVLAAREGPENTVSVLEYPDGDRMLLIDGFVASSNMDTTGYMYWMGRLPMLLHSNPQDALVICFGTGLTASAVRQEGLEQLDIVDISESVFAMAPYFTQNDDVLGDPRVSPQVMDGRIWLRRSRKQYDVITLEPMPPTFAGTNSLYSREFYELARGNLKDEGIVAQWLPFHLVTLEEAAAVVRTFIEVFPDTRLWIDPVSTTGILLGRQSDEPPGSPWPIYWPEPVGDEIHQPVANAFLPDVVVLGYARGGRPITDDNQLLSYGPGRSRFMLYDLNADNFEYIRAVIEANPGARRPESPRR